MSYTLQSHALPNRALLLINEYSKPLTRPDWRKSKPLITTYLLYLYEITNANTQSHINRFIHSQWY